MQKTAIGLALLTAAGLSTAQEMGQVISATPIVQQVTVPQQSCYEETVMPAQRASTGGGAILGAVVGGLIGTVVDQSPAAGEMLARGSTVTLTYV